MMEPFRPAADSPPKKRALPYEKTSPLAVTTQ